MPITYNGTPDDLLTYTAPSVKLTRQADGVYRYQAHNLLLQSEDFSTSWVNVSTTETVNAATAPNGTQTADKLNETTATASFSIYQNTTGVGASTTFSVYAKAAERTAIYLRLYKDNNDWEIAVFDLSNGTNSQNASGASTTFTGRTQSVESVGSGWYRCSITAALPTGAIGCLIHTSNAASGITFTSFGDYAYAGNAANGVYVWGAQLRRNPSPSTYLATTTTARYALPYEWDASGNPLGILVEEARTNLLLRSTQFDDVNWSKTGSGTASAPTVSANYAVAPDGTTTADRVQLALNGGTTTGEISQIIQTYAGYTAGTAYTFSVWLKSNTGSNQTVALVNANGQGSAVTVTPAWQLFTHVITASVTVASGAGIRLRGTFTGDSADILVWGAQLEVGSFATSPIETFGATATRAADNIYIGAASFPDALATGTVFAEFQQFSPAYGQFIIAHGGASVSIFNGGASYASYDGTSEVSLAAVTPGTTIMKAALSYTGSTRRGAVNGTTSGALAYDGSFSGTLWRFGSNSGVSNINGYFRKALIIPRAMTSSELQTLTS